MYINNFDKLDPLLKISSSAYCKKLINFFVKHDFAQEAVHVDIAINKFLENFYSILICLYEKIEFYWICCIRYLSMSILYRFARWWWSETKVIIYIPSDSDISCLFISHENV